ncbi:LysM peptidoglycan-binding domain-containing protein [Quadrisphaera sp. GCM10027208]|uniref:LysM peptidoglycan-binding domain-containing protein n=1 Tax=Quadrisphaera sp. GCM10027208 TaxID=3273423 RepID=UPI0036240CB1
MVRTTSRARTGGPGRSGRTAGAGTPWARLGVLTAGLAAGATAGIAAVRAGTADVAGLVAGGVPAASPAGLTQAVVAVGTVAVGLGTLWLVAGAALTAVDLLATRAGTPAPVPVRRAAATAPRATQRLVAAVLGMGIACGTAGAAGAVPAPAATEALVVVTELATQPATEQATEHAAESPAWQDPFDPGWRAATGWTPARAPDPAPRPTATQPAASLPASEAAPARAHLRSEDAVVVRRGDTLWDIAARSLPAGAGAAEIAAEWPRWWAANRDVIGPDPDLLLPGQRLVPPAAGS